MEENKPPLVKATFGYGLLLALAMIIYSLILYVAGLDRQNELNYLTYVILLAGILIASLNYRNKYLGGFATYGQAVGAGFMTALFASIVMAIYTYIFFTFVDPGAMEEAMVMAEEGMMDRGMSDQEIDQAMTMVAKFQQPWVWATFALLGNAIIGLIISLITSIFVKKEDKNIIMQ